MLPSGNNRAINNNINLENSLTLTEYLQQVGGILRRAGTMAWVRTEINSIGDKGGHIYLTLADHVDGSAAALEAQASAHIWRSYWPAIEYAFAQATNGGTLERGMQILALCEATLHPKYGFSLNITQVDPSFTIGNLALKKQETIDRLQREGLMDMNKQYRLPAILQKVAVISSDTAAGYGDFMNHITYDNSGYRIYTKLYNALMQGEQSPRSIIGALEEVRKHWQMFDCVVIIRGGGSTTDLLAFDDYELCRQCAMFELPIISGIGHERDTSIVDMVANTRCKTPTAVADLLLEKFEACDLRLLSMASGLAAEARSVTAEAGGRLTAQGGQLMTKAKELVAGASKRLEAQRSGLEMTPRRLLDTSSSRLKILGSGLAMYARNATREDEHRLELFEKQVQANSPQRILEKGYTLTTDQDGRIVRSPRELVLGMSLTTHFAHGTAISQVRQVAEEDAPRH